MSRIYCEDCMYFRHTLYLGDETGLCMFHPPSVIVEEGKKVTDARPTVLLSDFCALAVEKKK